MEPHGSNPWSIARERLLRVGAQSRAEHEAVALTARGPADETLYVDALRFSATSLPRTRLIVSSGLHGVEGCLGSAAQHAILTELARGTLLCNDVEILCLHALNPFGFAWQRRVNESNVDLNRNFLLTGQTFAGVSPVYARAVDALNPRRWSLRDEMLWLPKTVLASHGDLTGLKRAIAQGQYEYERGLFFGGRGPSELQEILARRMHAWFGGCERVLHLDIHTGLGGWGECTMGIELREDDPRFVQLASEFSPFRVQGINPRGTLYETLGGMDRWIAQRLPACSRYDPFLVEIGTYSILRVLTVLRHENRVFHHGGQDSGEARRVRAQLLEAFFPSSRAWRSGAIQVVLDIVRRGIAVLSRAGGSVA